MKSDLVGAGLMPDGFDVRAGYATRNVGHLMGKQESFVTEFRPNSPYVLQAGAIGAAEIQWPAGKHGIAAEEMWVVTDLRRSLQQRPN